MGKRRTRRLRKKLHLGEFREFGFELSMCLCDGLSEAEFDRFWDAFLVDAIEAQGLLFGGGKEGFVVRKGGGSVTEAQRLSVHDWLCARPEISSVAAGPLVDAWQTEARFFFRLFALVGAVPAGEGAKCSHRRAS